MINTKSFSNFTNQYALSKTLRFELKPIGKTLEKMKENLQYDKNLQTFLKDQEIEDAYQYLKPKIDTTHEQFINDSLESDEAKAISFENYLEAYKQKQDLSEVEKALRKQIGETYEIGGEKLKKKYPNLKWKKGSSTATGYKMLFTKDILEVVRDKYSDEQDIEKHLNKFKNFFTYLGGFNQNRENYYETGSEKATAIATRIISENLPKFCDNNLQFFGYTTIRKNKKTGEEKEINFNRKEEYLNAYQYLKDNNKTTQIKDSESDEMIEATPITEDIFKISHFSQCLSQRQIEEYNRIVGHYNLLINLYNQAKSSEDKNYKKLPQFKKLYKQIGCGKKEPLFFSLTHVTKAEAEKNKENYPKPYSVEQIFEDAKSAGKKYFSREKSNGGDAGINTIFDFTNWLRNNTDWHGVYWSKQAINTISNKYFANWHKIKDELKSDKTVATFNKKREEQIKINDAVELAGLFAVLDNIEMQEGWSKHFFKPSIIKDRKIDEQKTPSENLINLLCEDLEENAKAFLDYETVEKVFTISDYKQDENKKLIKEWLDYTLAVTRMIKYFQVKPNKIKGQSIKTEIVNALDTLLYSDDATWFKWYDAVRNYLTKKPQDDVKENKLKLNFECPSLLGGWSDGQEKVKKSVILQNNNKYYLGILKKSSLFDTKKENNQIYAQEDGGAGRLILANLGFKTLAGRGFIRDYKQAYGEMGKEDPLKAVRCLQELIKKQYVDKYPALKGIASRKYNDKKTFDKEVKEALAESYICEFKPIDWNVVEKHIEDGDLYLFEIYSKDNSKKSKGKKNLQTLYWENVLQKNSKHQLNGGGEIFYRKRGIKDKKVKSGYEDKPWVIKGKRFTENATLEKDTQPSDCDGKSFFFHCPIKINYKAKDYRQTKYALTEVNQNINSNLINNEIYFLGLDRGEKHLVYYSLIDKDGNLKKQGSFNIINGHNYYKKIEEKAKDRDKARKNWQTIGEIKNLKEGYISQVVHEIVKIVTDKPTFIVLEDLNTGFKRGRQKIEKQIYQKFEVALAKKLNFVVDKTAKNGEIGSVTKALQLTPPVQNYQDIENKKQVGIMLYTRANYTSITDPKTGWRKTVYLQKGSEEKIKEQIINAFDDIGFHGKDYYFEYTDKNTNKKWMLWSGKDGVSLLRYRGRRGQDKNEWIIEEQNIVDILDKVFENFDKNRSLLSQIIDEGVALQKYNDKFTAWESLRFAIDLIQQIRNSGDEEKKQDDNFLLSPVRDENGNHFDSTKIKEDDKLPIDADANGAFNIARKGLLMCEHIKIWIDAGMPKYKKYPDLDLFISDKEWDLYLTNKEEWKDNLKIFSSKEKMEEFRKK